MLFTNCTVVFIIIIVVPATHDIYKYAHTHSGWQLMLLQLDLILNLFVKKNRNFKSLPSGGELFHFLECVFMWFTVTTTVSGPPHTIEIQNQIQ